MCEIIVVTSGKGGVGKDYSQSWRRSESAWKESVND